MAILAVNAQKLCHRCGTKGHIARDCEQPTPDSHDGDPVTQHHADPSEENAPTEAAEIPTPPSPPPEHIEEDPPTEEPQPDESMNGKENVVTHDFLRPGTKRTLQSDSDSDNAPKPQRRTRIKPTPNVNVARTRRATKEAQDSKLPTDEND